jgi:hypothetical protein
MMGNVEEDDEEYKTVNDEQEEECNEDKRESQDHMQGWR